MDTVPVTDNADSTRMLSTTYRLPVGVALSEGIRIGGFTGLIYALILDAIFVISMGINSGIFENFFILPVFAVIGLLTGACIGFITSFTIAFTIIRLPLSWQRLSWLIGTLLSISVTLVVGLLLHLVFLWIHYPTHYTHFSLIAEYFRFYIFFMVIPGVVTIIAAGVFAHYCYGTPET